MGKQKVITVNINSSKIDEVTGYNEIELTKINKYLDDGWIVISKFSTVSNANNLYCVNLTFILEKEE